MLGSDQLFFLFTSPMLDLLFARDGIVDVGKLLHVNELIDVISGGELSALAVLVLGKATLQIVGDAHVNGRTALVG